MKQQEFNLIDEPWICVRTLDCEIKEVSLLDVFQNAQNYVGLAGETKTQDFAVLRLLLAILHTVFSRYGLQGEEIDLSENSDLAVDQWAEIWNQGKIPSAPIERYFREWHDRFWLFDTDYPFYQSKAVQGKSTPISTAKLIGTLFESANKKRIFSERYEDGRKLSYAEATRWLLHLNCFDDIAAKKPTPKKSWVGKLGLVALKGNNFFETLLLNFVADCDINHSIFHSTPSWEQNNNVLEFNRLIPVPDNQAGLLSLQSRRIFLYRENDSVTKYYLSGGDYFEDEELLTSEMMTLWRGYQEKKGSPFHYKPRIYDPSKKFWREFGSIVAKGEENTEHSKQAGVIGWLNRLISYEILDDSMFVKVQTTSVIYDYKQATSLPVIDNVSDTLTFHAILLEDVGVVLRAKVLMEIENCEKAANAVRNLYKNLQKASGRQDKDGKTDLSGEMDAKTEFYARIDRPFRLWLAGLDPAIHHEDEAIQIEKQLKEITLRFGRELASQIGNNAIFGRHLKDSQKEITSSAEALNLFYHTIKLIFTKAGDET